MTPISILSENAIESICVALVVIVYILATQTDLFDNWRKKDD